MTSASNTSTIHRNSMLNCGTKFQISERYEWDQRNLDFYKKCVSDLDQTSLCSSDVQPLIIGHNSISFLENGEIFQHEVNGWPIGQDFKEALEEYHILSQKYNIEHMIRATRDKLSFLRYLVSTHRAQFLSHRKADTSIINKKVEYRNLSNIPDNTKYIYPIEFLGWCYPFTTIAKTTGFSLPDRIINDAKNKLCKILLHDHMEGQGFNLKHPEEGRDSNRAASVKQIIETASKFYDIPIESFGFLDGNYLTPELQKTYGAKGFFYPYWEYHLGRVHCHSDQEMHSLQDTITRRLRLQKSNELESQHRFVCLNRRVRPHRIILTSYIHANHDSKILWSFLMANAEIFNLKNRLTEITEKSELSEQDKKYIKLLPKNIDIDCNTNDTQLNEVQYKGAINLITETLFFESDTLFFSEKIYKPILAGQPFILVGNPKSLKLLRQQGYETFSPWIDESYDDIIDPVKRMQAILKEIDRLCNKPKHEFKGLMSSMADVCLRNHLRFVSRRKKLEYLSLIFNNITDWLYNE